MHLTMRLVIAAISFLTANAADDANVLVQGSLRAASSRLAPASQEQSKLRAELRRAKASVVGLRKTLSSSRVLSATAAELRLRKSDVVVLKEQLAAKDARLRSLNVDPATTEVDEQVGDLVAELEATKAELSSLKEQMAQMIGDAAMAKQENKKEAEYVSTAKELASTNTDIATLETELDRRDAMIRDATSAPAASEQKPAVASLMKGKTSKASQEAVDNFFQGNLFKGKVVGAADNKQVPATAVAEATAAVTPQWSYNDAADWGNQFLACAGTEQSPIDLEFEQQTDDLEPSEQLQFTLKPLSMIPIVNNQRTLQVEGPFGQLHLHSGTYTVEQFHFHFPSQHTFNGRQAAGELTIAFHREAFRGPKDLVMVSIMLDVPAKKPEPPPPLPQIRFEMDVEGLPEGLIMSQKRVLTDAVRIFTRGEMALVAPCGIDIMDIDAALNGKSLNVTYNLKDAVGQNLEHTHFAFEAVMTRLNSSSFVEGVTKTVTGQAGFGKVKLTEKDGPHFYMKEFTVPEPLQPTEEVSTFFENIGFEPLGLSPLPGALQYKLIPDSVDLSAFAPQLGGHYLRYTGSLTSPPCTQGVRWIVLTKPAIIPSNVLQTFNAYFPRPKNNRPVQSLNGRIVRMDGGGVDDSEPLAIRTELAAQAYEGKHAWYYNDFADWEKRYPECGGDRQSPIDIWTRDSNLSVPAPKKEPLTEEQQLKADYVPKERRLIVNNGHSLQVDGQFGTVVMPDGIYDAKQFHFHFPSEHAINGKTFAGEMHIVHQRRGSVGANDLLTIAILLQPPNKTLEQEVKPSTRDFFANLGFQPLMPRALPKEGFALQVFGAVDLGSFKEHMKGRFTCYWGSLTTPPCAETVKWMVFNEPLMVPNALVQHFKVAYPSGINRPLQPLNDRLVKDSCHSGGYIDNNA